MFVLVLAVGITLYFYLNDGEKAMPIVQPITDMPYKPKVTVEHDFEFSPQELEQMKPDEALQSQVGNSEAVQQVFSPPPEWLIRKPYLYFIILRGFHFKNGSGEIR